MTRASRSRPSASVPRRCAAEGGARRASRLIWAGSASGSSGAAIARPTTTAIHSNASQKTKPSRRPPRPMAAPVSTISVASSAAMADARIERGVEQVDEEIDDDEGDGDEQHAALQHDEVARVDALDQQAPDAGQREDRFDDHGAADEPADIEPDHGHQRERGRLQRMDKED